jgi:hypothetical protein
MARAGPPSTFAPLTARTNVDADLRRHDVDASERWVKIYGTKHENCNHPIPQSAQCRAAALRLAGVHHLYPR